jgi:Lon protease-like protein
MDGDDTTSGAPSIRIPLFPLGLVLFPGLVLPLHIFEERYRELVRDLVAAPDPGQQRFGVVAIRHGREVGIDSADALYDIGTIAVLTEVQELPDGRFQIGSVGGERFRLLALDHSKPYLQADVEILGDPLGAPDVAAGHVPLAQAAFRAYVDQLALSREQAIEVPELPTDPQVLSNLIAATVVVDLPVRQRLLAAPDIGARLTAEIALLRTETRLLTVMDAAPAPDLTRAPQSLN